jgi:hypothetical protein
MKAFFHPSLAFAAALVLLTAGVGSTEEIALVPLYRPGDSYLLNLGATTETDASSGGSVNKRFHKQVQVDYEATVVILEVDGKGRPVRERHEDVSMLVQSPRGSGPVFEEGTSFEVHRGDGEITVFFGNRRADPKREKAIVQVLETQFEHTLEPSLLDPGRPVAVGETWELDRSLVRKLLWQRGVPVVQLGEPATATLLRRMGDGDKSALEIDYRIPIAWLNVRRMLPDAVAGESEGLLEGTIRLASLPDRTPVSRKSSLAVTVNGVTTTFGQVNARPYPWSVRSLKTAKQTAAKVGTKYAGPTARVVGDQPAD